MRRGDFREEERITRGLDQRVRGRDAEQREEAKKDASAFSRAYIKKARRAIALALRYLAAGLDDVPTEPAFYTVNGPKGTVPAAVEQHATISRPRIIASRLILLHPKRTTGCCRTATSFGDLQGDRHRPLREGVGKTRSRSRRKSGFTKFFSTKSLDCTDAELTD